MDLKIDIEINYVSDGRVFLNFWDYIYGEDVTTEVIDGKLIENGKEITITDFIDKVKKVVRKY